MGEEGGGGEREREEGEGWFILRDAHSAKSNNTSRVRLALGRERRIPTFTSLKGTAGFDLLNGNKQIK